MFFDSRIQKGYSVFFVAVSSQLFHRAEGGNLGRYEVRMGKFVLGI